MEPTSPSEPNETGPAQIAAGTRCVICGYELSGLWLTGVCPECGTPAERSLKGDRLAYSAPGYVASLRRGAGVINLALLAQTLSFVGQIAWGIAGAAASASASAYSAGFYVFSGVQFLASVAGLVGWWLLSAPEPRLTGAHLGQGARFWVRVSIVAQVAVTALGFALSFAAPATGPQGGAALGVAAGGLVLGLTNLVVYALWFFASMLYLRWLAPRIPSRRVHDWSKTFIWLGPVLMIVGAPCFMLGPLAAYVCYWVMLYRVWSELRGIEMAPEAQETTG